MAAPPRKSRTAASLLEVVAGVGILAIVVVSVLLFLPFSIFSQAKAGRLYEANSVATSLVEQAKSQPYSSFTIGEIRDVSGRVVVKDLDYKAELKVLDVTDVREKGYLKEVVVTVRWSERDGIKSVTKAGYVSKIQR